MSDYVTLQHIVWDDPKIGTLFHVTDGDMYDHALVYIARTTKGRLPHTKGNPVFIHYHTDDNTLRFCIFAETEEDFPTIMEPGTKIEFSVNGLDGLNISRVPIPLSRAIWKWCLENPNTEE